MKHKIARILKEARNSKNYSAEYVVKELLKYDIKLSPVTLYGYENAVSQPKADMFVFLCKIYGITSIDVFFDDDKHIKTVSEIDDMYNKLDTEDRAEIRGEIKQMLKSDKYKDSDSLTDFIQETLSEQINSALSNSSSNI